MRYLFYVFCDSFLKNQLAKNLLAFLTLLFLLLPQYSCNTTEPLIPPEEQPPKAIKLKLLDVSCTEAFIKVTAADTVLPVNVTLKKDNAALFNFTLTKTDTTVIDTALQPNITYAYQTTAQIKGKEENSDTIQAKTLNTTSHNFTWQTFIFGDAGAGSSTLYDVAIIDENNIWAVGEIYMNDSLGNPDPTRYNAAIWNGQDWSLKRIPYNYQGLPFYNPIQSVFAFSENDIWFCGNGVIHFDGTIFIPITIPTNVWGPYQMNKLWGSSSNDLYAVGKNGNIAHYQNGNWTKIESGTDLEFLDIYGATDAKTNELQILAVCTRNLPLDKAIYKIDGNTATQISSTPIQWELFSCWFVPNRHYYVVGSGIYEKKSLTDSLWKNEPLDITHYGTSGIRGNGINDVFVAGAFGEFLHFNGISWRSYINETGWFIGSYGGIAVKNNFVITVGYEGAQAKIMMGYR